MTAVERRKKILEKLESSGEVINATHLAEEFNVTRQKRDKTDNRF